MEIKNIKIELIKPYSKNAKKHTKEQIQKVANSIKRFGFVQPLVLDKNNEIIIGHCRLDGSKLLKMTEVPCVIADGLTDDEVKALRIADNRLNESDWDYNLLLVELNLITPELVYLSGFDDAFIEENMLSAEVYSDDDLDLLDEDAVKNAFKLGKRVPVTVEKESAVKNQNKVAFFTNNFEEYQKIRNAFGTKLKAELDTTKLLDLI